MSKVEVVMPQLGESLTEGTIVKWHKKPGDKIRKDETLLEISTDKVDSEIPSPVSGIVTKLLFEEQSTVAVRTVIAEVDTDVSAPVEASAPAPASDKKQQPQGDGMQPEKQVAKAEAVQAQQEAKQPAAPAPQPAAQQGQAPTSAAGRFYSPLVLNIAREEGVGMAELEQVPGTGEGGRVSKKDILSYVANRKKGGAPAPAPAPPATAQEPAAPAPAPAGPAPSGPSAPRIETGLKHVETGDLAQKYPAPQFEILQMSNVLQRMAQHMVNSVQTSPHVQAVHECDMTVVDKVRRSNAAAFEKREGFKLTFMPFVCDAVVKALKQYPLVNSSIEGDKIILKKAVNLGIAVASENGLIVPVIKNADEKNLVGLARGVNDLASRTRAKRLTPGDIEGGTFTITNYGVFGTMVGMPIIAQPQVAILGIGAAKKRPVIINDAIAIRLISYLTLAFDHRIIDGALGGMFLEAVIKNLQELDRDATV